MKKTVLMALILAAVVSLLTALPVGAAWAEKVTGGGQAYAGAIRFSITVSAWDDGYGGAAGQIEYARHEGSWTPLSMHVAVKCLGSWDDRAVAAGPAWAQDDPGNWLTPGNWVIVNVKEGGIGAGDTVRVYQGNETAAMAACQRYPSDSEFPGTIYDGNFNIRAK